MFKKQTVKAFSVVAIILSIFGLILSILGAIFAKSGSAITLSFFMGILSWALLLWASFIGYKLCDSYQLYEEEYKKIGYRIYAIILAFILFFFVGLVLGAIIAGIILSSLWGLKRNYDE